MKDKLRHRPARARVGETLPTAWKPEGAGIRIAKAEAVIEYAQKVKDWPLLEQAVDAKIEEQQAIVAWWHANVTTGHGGRRSKYPERRTCSVAEAEAVLKIKQQEESRWAARLEDVEGYRDHQLGAARRTAMLTPEDNHRAEGTGLIEWYTPANYIEAARHVLGEIDLDPASSAIAQRTVKATRYFSVAEDGLTHDWPGRVWLNPPYAQPAIANFVAKWADEFAAGRMTESVMLTHNYTDTAWFHRAIGTASRVCFTRGRIAFLDERGRPAAPTQGQAFFYVGPRPDYFTGVFAPYGAVAEPVAP